MTGTKKKSTIFVVALAVLAALIVILAVTLSACSGDENDTNEPTPAETAQPETTTAPESANASAGSTVSTASAAGSTGKSSGNSGASKSSGSTGSSTSAKKDSGTSSERDKVKYIMNYGDNVENGVESAADDFVGSLKDIGNAYDKGNVEGIKNTVGSFTKGLDTFLGGIKDTIIP